MTSPLKSCRVSCLSLFLSCVAATALHAADTPGPTCSLQARVFDADGHEFLRETAGVQVFVFLWQKIVDENAVRGTDWQSIVHSPDGSSWRRLDVFYLRDPGWTTQWPVKRKVSPGEYRFSFTVHKIFTKWEGPPGTSETTSGASQGRMTKVDGYGSPKRIYGWGLSDVITVGAEDQEKTVDLRPDAGPKVRLRTTFYPPPVKTAADVANADSNAEKKPAHGFGEASGITMRVFREENFSPDSYHESNSYGIPWHIDFDRMKPGRYCVHFYRGATPPETGTTAATDIFSFDVTEDGSNEFVFTPEKSLAENATWQVVGTVRDENGKPMPKVHVSALGLMPPGDDFPRNEGASGWTDAEGKYRMIFTPSPSQSGAIYDTETKCWRWGFRLQQTAIQASHHHYHAGEHGTPDRKGDLIFLGEFATDELRNRLAERSEDMILVEMNRPTVVDFTIPPPGPEIPWQELDANPQRRQQRFESLEHRKTLTDSDSQKLFRDFVLPNSLNRSYVDATEIAWKISATLTSKQPTFMFGEPVELKWNIANGSEFDVSVMLDENMGNPTVVWAVSDDGEPLLEKERFGWSHSGPVYYERIPPKGSYPYSIFMPDKFAFPNPGRYTINVARNLSVRRIEPPKDDRDRWNWRNSERWKSVSAPIFSSTTIEIVPTDSVQLGTQIDELVRTIRDREGREKYREAEKALKILCAIDDQRVIPCLIAEIREDNYSFAFNAIGALSKFKSDAAFEGIKKALTLADHNLLLSAAYALQRSKHPDAVAELLKNQDHPNYSVRLIVVQSADKMDRETALNMLRKRFDDPGWEGSVGKEARRIYKELTDEKSKDEEDEPAPKPDAATLFRNRVAEDVHRYDKMSKHELLAEILRRSARLAEKNTEPKESKWGHPSTNPSVKYGILLAKTGRLEDARKYLEEAERQIIENESSENVYVDDHQHESMTEVFLEAGLIDEARRSAARIVRPDAKAKAWAAIAVGVGKSGAAADAERIFQEALVMLTKNSNNNSEEDAFDWPLLAIAEGMAEIGLYSQAMETARTINDWYAQERCVRTIARIQRKAGLDVDAAATINVLTHPTARVNALTDIAYEKMKANDFTTAKKFLDDASKIAATVEDGYWRSDAYRDIGRLYARSGDLVKARAAYDESIRIVRDESDYLRSNLPESFSDEQKKRADFRDRQCNLGNIAASQSWVGLHEDALRTAKLIEPGEERDSAYDRIASGYARNGKDDEAIELVETIGTRWRRQTGLQGIAKAQIEQGRLNRALDTILRMQEDDDKDYGYKSMSTIAEASLKGECLAKLAESYARAGRHAESLALADRIVDPVRCLEAYTSIIDSIEMPDEVSSSPPSTETRRKRCHRIKWMPFRYFPRTLRSLP